MGESVCEAVNGSDRWRHCFYLSLKPRFSAKLAGASSVVQPTMSDHWRSFSSKKLSTSSNTSSPFVVVVISLLTNNSLQIASLVITHIDQKLCAV